MGRRFVDLAVAAAGAAVVIVVAACAPPVGSHSLVGDPTPVAGQALAPPPSIVGPPTTTTTTLPPTTTAGPGGRPPRPYAVGTTALDLTDSSRPTGSTPGRHLPTTVWYPATGAVSSSDTASAPPLGHGWPLIIFAEGYNTTPQTYEALLHYIASTGYVVMAPAFPLETAGGTLNEGDLNNEPADIDYVITQAIANNLQLGLLGGMIDPNHIGLIGHSDGGEAVLGAAYEPGVASQKVGPVITMSAEGALLGTTFPKPATKKDLMIVQGTADTINPPSSGPKLFSSAPSPKCLLQLLGGGHLPPFMPGNQWFPVVETTVVDWFDAWSGGPYVASAAPRLGHDGGVAGVAQVQLG